MRTGDLKKKNTSAYETAQATDEAVGGIKANARTTENSPVVIDAETGFAYVSNNGGIAEIPIATDTTLGGILADAKTDETNPVVIDETGKLFVGDMSEIVIGEVAEAEPKTKIVVTNSTATVQIAEKSDLDTKQDIPIEITFTAIEVATGVDILDNQEISVDGAVENFIVNSITGANAINFIAGENVNFMIPVGTGWAGGDPTFESGKIYNVVHYKSSWYADGGR